MNCFLVYIYFICSLHFCTWDSETQRKVLHSEFGIILSGNMDSQIFIEMIKHLFVKYHARSLFVDANVVSVWKTFVF